MKKVAKKAVKKVVKAVEVPVAPVETRTSKEIVAEFLTGKSYRNSRIAFREFVSANPTVKIKQNYFYTLFTLFGTRMKKSDIVKMFIASTIITGCFDAYKEYKKDAVSPVAFAYFLNIWKRHFGLTGSIRTKKEVKSVELSTLSARQIIEKATELLKEKAASLPTNLKNKGAIVKSATQLFKAEGYLIAQ